MPGLILDLGGSRHLAFPEVVTPLTLRHRRHAAQAALAAVVTLAGTAAVVRPVGADQLSNDRAQAQALANRINQLGQTEAGLGEQYDAAVIVLQQADQRVTAASQALRKAQAGQLRTLELLRQEAVQAYVGGGPEMQLAGGGPLKDVNQALFRQELEQSVASNEQDVLNQYQLATATDAAARLQLLAARNLAAAKLARLKKARSQVQAAQDQLIAAEGQVKGRIALLVAEIRREQLLAEQRAAEARLAAEQAALARAAAQAAAAARAQAAAAARQRQEQAAAAARAQAVHAQAVQVPVTTATTATTAPASAAPSSPPPASSSAAAIAVAAAESRVGDPYVWGAAGPDAFDCSGLVMWAWAQAGVSLPHYSGAQYADTTPIPMSDLQPGDLVFPADPGQHVAMYVGNGEIVQAPYTGADVQIVPLTSFFVLATRVG
ncbi:MAG: NlpC/P60 family protein [Acidimicrobiales bacterium]